MASSAAESSWFAERPDGVRLSLKVTPRAAREAIQGVELDARGDAWLAIRVTASPEAGKANAEVIRLLAKRLGVPGRDLSLVSGAASRRKVLHLQGAPAALVSKLKALG